ncbi:hypothetical protein CFIMG_003506RA [Ceratocystis fimbriata CBS 114723]|uniref:C3H1-type domain-containing protein n=1 Tax=Ceratocystis fimbriata CBS 114723 TaxID=1035309 RepID=A0A2C5X259_9PEZI|nr:hypothetical protein CFIMG_003506RA [Ceratocystis fimbriata CBS 114723]
MMQWDNNTDPQSGATGEDWFNQLGSDLNTWNNNPLNYGLDDAANTDPSTFFGTEDMATGFADISSYANSQDVLTQTFDPSFFGQDPKTGLSSALNNVADLHQESFATPQQSRQPQGPPPHSQPQFGFGARTDQAFHQDMQAFAGSNGPVSVAPPAAPASASAMSSSSTAPTSIVPQPRARQPASTTPVQHQVMQQKPQQSSQQQPTHSHGSYEGAFSNGMTYSQPVPAQQQDYSNGGFPVSSGPVSVPPAVSVGAQRNRAFGAPSQQAGFNSMVTEQQMQHMMQAQNNAGYHMIQQPKNSPQIQTQNATQAQFQAQAQYQQAQEAQYQARLQKQAQIQRTQAAMQQQQQQQQLAGVQPGPQPGLQYMPTSVQGGATPGSQPQSQLGTPTMQQQHRIPSPQAQQQQAQQAQQAQQQAQQKVMHQSSVPNPAQTQAQAQARFQFQQQQQQQQQQQMYLQQQQQQQQHQKSQQQQPQPPSQQKQQQQQLPPQQQHLSQIPNQPAQVHQQPARPPATTGPLHIAKSAVGQVANTRSITPQGLKRSADDSAAGSPVQPESASNTEPAKKRTKRAMKKEEAIAAAAAATTAAQAVSVTNGQTGSSLVGSSSLESAVAGSQANSTGSAMAVAAAPVSRVMSSDPPTPVSTTADLLAVPRLSKTEMDQLTHHMKKSRASKLRPSPIAGADFMASTGTIKLSNPKSFDKLNPMIAMPSQSGRPVIKELGLLACEIQGRFSSKFQPSTDACGIDERRMESSALLDIYDQSMAALGKRRPKYTEYPHAFKEQLRADETVKSKADRHARKLADEEKGTPIRADARPSDEIEAAVWDLVDLVHIKADAVRTTALLGKAVQQTGDFIADVRVELSKSRTALDNATKEKKPESTLASLRQTLEVKKAKMLRVLETANTVGDEVVLESLGGHAKFVISMINTLIFCVKAGDYTDKLLKTALDTMLKLKFAASAANALANFEPVRKRLNDNGDVQLRATVKQIADKIVDLDATARKSKEATALTNTPAAVSTSSTVAKKAADDKTGPASATAAGSKARAGSALLPGKSRAAVKPAAKVDSSSKSDPIKALEEKKVTSTQLKKPLSRPDTARSDVAKTAASNSKPAASSTASSGGGFASLMQSINASKAKSPPKDSNKATPEPSETPEAREKRLRKEARRKLRVRWRSDHELVQVREFKKEDTDDDGEQSANLTKDAGDDKSEGMALRQRPIVDEDDEDDLPYVPWMEPTAIEIESVIDVRFRAKTYETRGGKLPVESDERAFLADRESRVLMAFYSDVSDIPPTPKSPPPEPAVEGFEPRIAHLPREDKYDEMQRRLRETRELGLKGALYNALRRVEVEEERLRAAGVVVSNNIGIPPSDMVMVHGNVRPVFLNSVGFLADETPAKLVALLSANLAVLNKPLGPTPHTKRRADHEDPEVQAAADVIEDLAALYAGKPEADEPPQWIAQNETRAQEWRDGYARDAGLRAKRTVVEKMQLETPAPAVAAAAAQFHNMPQIPGMPNVDSNNLAEMYNFFLQAQAQGQGASRTQQQQFPSATATQDQLMAAMSMLGQFGASGALPSGPASSSASYQPNMSVQEQSEDPYQARIRMTQEAEAAAANQLNNNGGGDWDDEYDPTREDWEMRDADAGSGGMGRDRGFRDNGSGAAGGAGNLPTGPAALKRKKPAKGALPPHRPANRALIGTKPCMFFKQGICARGEKCTFRHDL